MVEWFKLAQPRLAAAGWLALHPASNSPRAPPAQVDVYLTPSLLGVSRGYVYIFFSDLIHTPKVQIVLFGPTHFQYRKEIQLLGNQGASCRLLDHFPISFWCSKKQLIIELKPEKI